MVGLVAAIGKIKGTAAGGNYRLAIRPKGRLLKPNAWMVN
jgi:hypothetical protein